MKIEHYMKADNQILIITKAFALRVIKLYMYLKDEKKEFVMSKQFFKVQWLIMFNVQSSMFNKLTTNER